MSLLAGLLGGGGGGGKSGAEATSGNQTTVDFGSDSYGMPIPAQVPGLGNNTWLIIGGAAVAVLLIVLLLRKKL
jgi:hypothetical protein